MRPSIELVDIFDGSMNRIGTKSRDLVHKDGDWHRTVHCWIAYRDAEGADYVLFQKRSKASTWPGRIDITAAGHFRAGEELEGALREIREEIGVSVTSHDLIYLGKRVCLEDFLPGILNHEFQDIFLCIDGRPLEEYNLQPEELSGILAVRVTDLLALFRGNRVEIRVTGIEVDQQTFERRHAVFHLTKDSFVPSLDNYSYKIAVLVLRALRGELDLLI